MVSESNGHLAVPTKFRLRSAGVSVDSAESIAFDGPEATMLELGDAFEAPAGFFLVGLRKVLLSQPAEVARLAGRAAQMLEWRRTHRYCGVCGAANVLSEDEPALICQACEQSFYPRVTPAVIVLVERDNEILLARGQHLPEGFYSVLAGFVESGESLEEAAAREIREEVAIEIKNLRYFGSQPWPFPHSLMIAFTADYEGGEVSPDPREIAHADWFSFDRLPAVPPKLSIARELIDDFVRRMGGDTTALEEWGPR